MGDYSVMVVSPTTRRIHSPSTFGEVQEIYVVNSIDVYLYVEILHTEGYNHHYSAYVTKRTQEYHLIHVEQFVSHVPLHTHKICSLPHCPCIIPKFVLNNVFTCHTLTLPR